MEELSKYQLRVYNGDEPMVTLLRDHGVTSINRLSATADFGARWAFELTLDGRYCGVRHLTVMESANPARTMLRIVQALKTTQEQIAAEEMGDGNVCGR